MNEYNSDNGWSDWKNHVLFEIKRLNTNIEGLNKQVIENFADTQKQITENSIQIDNKVSLVELESNKSIADLEKKIEVLTVKTGFISMFVALFVGVLDVFYKKFFS